MKMVKIIWRWKDGLIPQECCIYPEDESAEVDHLLDGDDVVIVSREEVEV